MLIVFLNFSTSYPIHLYAFFGLLLSWFYAQAIVIPNEVPQSLIAQVSTSIGEAVQAVKQVSPSIADQVISAAQLAFSQSHRAVLEVAATFFLVLTVFIWFALPKRVEIVEE